MLDRIVPVHRTDLMSLYYLILGLAARNATPVEAESPGVFDVENTQSTCFCAEPVKRMKINPETEQSYFFVTAFDFEGIYNLEGEKIEYIEGGSPADFDSVGDGVTLFQLDVSTEDGNELSSVFSLKDVLDGAGA